LGLLHLRSEPIGIGPQSIPESVQKLAEKVTEHIGLALSNLDLKNTLLIQAIRDPLTGLFNRRYMEETLERELHRSSRYGTPLGIVLIDLDEFKNINDTMGHDTGDAVLKAMGDLLLQFFRGEDVACRYGGDEFTIILPESSLANTWQRAEQLREEWKKIKIKHEGNFIHMPTLSIGVAAFPDHGMKPDQLIQSADTAAYTAKSKGRDRVMLSSNREQ
jgi:diguanylate cyclase (GGDEF)-like protein